MIHIKASVMVDCTCVPSEPAYMSKDCECMK